MLKKQYKCNVITTIILFNSLFKFNLICQISYNIFYFIIIILHNNAKIQIFLKQFTYIFKNAV